MFCRVQWVYDKIHSIRQGEVLHKRVHEISIQLQRFFFNTFSSGVVILPVRLRYAGKYAESLETILEQDKTGMVRFGSQ